jgi:hypothetical protein
VPGGPPELAVRRGAQADVALHADGVGYRLVLDGAQPGVVDPSGGAVVARREQAAGAQETADVVGAERRTRPIGRALRGSRVVGRAGHWELHMVVGSCSRAS